MNRRTFLTGIGTGTLTGIAGCLGTSTGGDPSLGSTVGPTNDDDFPPDDSPRDGYPPAFGQTPEQRSIDTASFKTIDRDGITVPLVPTDVAYYWYTRGEARFAGTRGSTSYDRSHIYGAVLSTAPDGLETNDPIAAWPKTDRIVCYYACPNHMLSLRAASLLSDGYKEAYAIEEGYTEWQVREYPMAGENVKSRPNVRVIEGKSDSRYAGNTVWARHEPTGQRKATAIANDGSYRLELRFTAVTDESIIVVQTPNYRVETALGDLTNEIVTRESSV
jgi:rhodanese-related sulfurtransferase